MKLDRKVEDLVGYLNSQVFFEQEVFTTPGNSVVTLIYGVLRSIEIQQNSDVATVYVEGQRTGYRVKKSSPAGLVYL